MYLYEVRLQRGTSHPEWGTFFENIESFGAKAPGYSGSGGGAAISTPLDARTLKNVITHRLNNPNDVICTEITRATLKHTHAHYQGLVTNYFLPYNDYPNISRRRSNRSK